MVAQQGTFPAAFIENIAQNKTWIVDSVASHHMIRDTLHDYSPQKRNSSVRIVNGSLSTILVTDSVQLTKDILGSHRSYMFKILIAI